MFSSNNERTKCTKNAEPIERTEKADIAWGINMLIPYHNDGEVALGASLTFLGKSKVSNLWWGVYTDYHALYSIGLDTLHGDYDKLKTNGSVVGLGFSAKYRFFNSKNIDAYVKSSLGLSVYQTKSYFIDDDYECEDGKSRRKLKSVMSPNRNLSLTFGLQAPITNMYDKFYIEISYILPAKTTKVQREDVSVSPNQISYLNTTSILNFFSPQIGFSHYF